MAWLIVMTAGVLIALALGNTIALLATIAVGALGGLLVLRAAAQTLARSPSAARMPYAQRPVLAADGTPRQALVVPAESVDGYQTVLTIDGYALIDAEGNVVYMLGSARHTQASEPVTVTI
jgi:hypothetical protein